MGETLSSQEWLETSARSRNRSLVRQFSMGAVRNEERVIYFEVDNAFVAYRKPPAR